MECRAAVLAMRFKASSVCVMGTSFAFARKAKSKSKTLNHNRTQKLLNIFNSFISCPSSAIYPLTFTDLNIYVWPL